MMRKLSSAAIIVAAISGICASQALSHSWYTGFRNPTTGVDCCGGADCTPIDVNRIVETVEEFVIDSRWHFRKDEAMPSFDGAYHACIWGGRPRCFFFPSNV
jgi:hypothetical protein